MKRVWNLALIFSFGYASQMGFHLSLTGVAVSLSSQDKQADQHSSPNAPNHAEDMFSTEEPLMEQCWECQAFVLLMDGMEEEEHREFLLARKRLGRKWRDESPGPPR